MFVIKQLVKSRILLICFAFCATISLGYADDLQDALTLYEEGKHKKALKLLLPLAEQGNLVAQTKVGLTYIQGLGTDRDEVKGFKWIEMAANKGHADAEFIMGNIYSRGLHEESKDLHIEKDADAALEWFNKAAKQGLAKAQYALGAIYFSGIAVPKDDLMSYVWMSLANKFGHDLAAGYATTIADTLSDEQIEEANTRVMEIEEEIARFKNINSDLNHTLESDMTVDKTVIIE